MERVSNKTVTFTNSFKLGDSEETYPAGSYVIETVEELVQELSFTAYRRTATYLRRVSPQGSTCFMPSELIDPQILDAALAADRTAR